MEKLELTFSYLVEKDLEGVAKLYDEERSVVTNLNKMKQTFKKIKKNPDYKMIVVKHNDIIVGFAKVIIHHDIFEENNPFATVWSVRVRRKYRRLKIGSRLFEHIESIAKEMNCEFICLFADKNNVSANGFYKKLGYECDNGYVKILKNIS